MDPHAPRYYSVMLSYVVKELVKDLEPLITELIFSELERLKENKSIPSSKRNELNRLYYESAPERKNWATLKRHHAQTTRAEEVNQSCQSCIPAKRKRSSSPLFDLRPDVIDVEPVDAVSRTRRASERGETEKKKKTNPLVSIDPAVSARTLAAQKKKLVADQKQALTIESTDAKRGRKKPSVVAAPTTATESEINPKKRKRSLSSSSSSRKKRASVESADVKHETVEQSLTQPAQLQKKRSTDSVKQCNLIEQSHPAAAAAAAVAEQSPHQQQQFQFGATATVMPETISNNTTTTDITQDYIDEFLTKALSATKFSDY